MAENELNIASATPAWWRQKSILKSGVLGYARALLAGGTVPQPACLPGSASQALKSGCGAFSRAVGVGQTAGAVVAIPTGASLEYQRKARPHPCCRNRHQGVLCPTFAPPKAKRRPQAPLSLCFPTEFGRREWTRTIDPHHVKVVL